MQKLIQMETSEILGCSFVTTEKLEKRNSRANCCISEKANCVSVKLFVFAKRGAPFKNTILST